jgi:hypothetical protein
MINLIALIVGNPAAGSTADMNPIDSVGLVSITIGLIVFLYFAITVSIGSYRRRKEMEAQIAEWKRREEERKQRLKERLAELETI